MTAKRPEDGRDQLETSRAPDAPFSGNCWLEEQGPFYLGHVLVLILQPSAMGPSGQEGPNWNSNLQNKIEPQAADFPLKLGTYRRPQKQIFVQG